MTEEQKNNMPDKPRALFEYALEDETWTWAGLADLFYNKLNDSDYKDLIYQLEILLKDEDRSESETTIE